jgi:hypothetical protein
MTDLTAEFARVRDHARASGEHRHEGCGWAENAANAVLEPWLDAIRASHRRHIEQLDAAISNFGENQ